MYATDSFYAQQLFHFSSVAFLISCLNFEIFAPIFFRDRIHLCRDLHDTTGLCPELYSCDAEFCTLHYSSVYLALLSDWQMTMLTKIWELVTDRHLRIATNLGNPCRWTFAAPNRTIVHCTMNSFPSLRSKPTT